MNTRTLVCGILLLGALATAAHAQFAVLYNFGTKSGDPLDPTSPGIIGQGYDGALYSTTSNGGTTFGGNVFKITPAGVLTVIHNFDGTVECLPLSGLTLATDGFFYGSTEGCGTSMLGTIFKINPTGSPTFLHNFTSAGDGGLPNAPPIQATDGNFYGTTRGSLTGGGIGTVYKLTSSGLFTIYHFDGTHGEFPAPPLIQGTDGNFYGTTEQGGKSGAGVVFKITPSGSLAVLYNFDTTHGADPIGPLVQASDGTFYGTTKKGGTSNGGVVFKITSTGLLTVLHNFNGTSDGAHPTAGLVQATDGNFYGTATAGGSLGHGTIFEITRAGSFLVLYNFDSTHGATPQVTLVQHTNGILYGETFVGGTHGEGTFFRLNRGLPAFVTMLPYSGKVGKSIEILGQGFTSSTTVSFNGTSSTPILKSSTYLIAAVPNSATTGFVTVITSAGSLKSNKVFRVTPQITGFSPASGPVGTAVKISGVSLKQTDAVYFGGIKAASFAVNSDTQIMATVPTGAKTAHIAVKTAGGTATSAGTFTVTPSITGFSPTAGLAGTIVTITGTTLSGTTQVTFGGVAASSFSVNSDTQVTATVPNGAVTGTISITAPAGVATSAGIFTIASTLTGFCLHGGILACFGSSDPQECPVGAIAINPGFVGCGFPPNKAGVDLGRSCSTGGPGYCERTR